MKIAKHVSLILTTMIMLVLAGTSAAYAQQSTQPEQPSATHMPPGGTLKGAVISIDPYNHTIEVQNYLGKTKSIVVDENVQIYKCNQPVTLRELESGNLIIVKS